MRTALLGFLLAFAFLVDGSAWASPLGTKIQNELDSNPILKAQYLKLRMIEETDGNVVLEMTEGPQKLRTFLRKGNSMDGNVGDQHFTEEDMKALRTTKRVLKIIESFEGVKKISLMGAFDPLLDPPENSNEQKSPQPARSDPTPPAISLKDQIQKELDTNLYLQVQHMKMRLLDEKEGNVTLELTEGPRELRDLFRKGYEIKGDALAEKNLSEDAVMALRSVKRVLKTVGNLDGVKNISLTGAIDYLAETADTPKDKQQAAQGGSIRLTALGAEVQKALDSNPYLLAQQLKVRVLDERQGNLSLEITQGAKKLRDLFRKGYELNGNALAEKNLPDNVIQSLRSLRRALKGIKAMKGVKEIALTGAIDPLMDQAENYYDEACQIRQADSGAQGDAVPLLEKSAAMGFAPAQADLSFIFMQGMDVRGDEQLGVFWLKKAAEQGDPGSEYNLACLFEQGSLVDKDYKQAIAWYQKSAGQDRNPDVRTRSQVALALLLATCPNESLRDGNAALEYAKKGYAGAPEGMAIYTLAAAYGRCGRFEEAIEMETKWIHKLESANFLSPEQKESEITAAKARLKCYQDHKAYTAEE